MVLILTVPRVTHAAAILEARNASTQIPAAWALAEVSAQRSHVAQRRRSHGVARLRQRWKARSDVRVDRNVVDPCEGTDAHAATGLGNDAVRGRNGAEIEDHGGSGKSLLDADEQVCSAAKRDGLSLAGQLSGVPE